MKWVLDSMDMKKTFSLFVSFLTFHLIPSSSYIPTRGTVHNPSRLLLSHFLSLQWNLFSTNEKRKLFFMLHETTPIKFHTHFAGSTKKGKHNRREKTWGDEGRSREKNKFWLSGALVSFDPHPARPAVLCCAKSCILLIGTFGPRSL